MKEGLFFNRAGEFVKKITPLNPLLKMTVILPIIPGWDGPTVFKGQEMSMLVDFRLAEHYGDRLVYREVELVEK